MYKKYKKHKNKRGLVLAACLLAAVILGVGGWFYWQKNYSDNNKSEDVPVSDPAFTDGTDRGIAAPIERNGGITDTSGEDADDSQPGSKPLVSDSGKITVYQPTTEALIQSGSTISGLSSNSSVSFRIIDDVIGVIGTGSLKVVDGKFSGKFSFESEGTEGRVDIFSTLASGREVDVVEIPVRYQ
jgi:hypothetical protein